MARTASGGARPLRTRLALSATLVLCGIVLSVTDLKTLGGWLTVGALLVLVVSLHRYGRQGPDPE